MNDLTGSKVAIIIVSWNTKEYLEKCLSSIFEQTFNNFEVIFVDNGSTDGSVELVRIAFPTVRLVSLDKNYGFSKANNIGIRLAFEGKARHIVLLNVDTTIKETFLKELVTAAESDDSIGCCQSKMLSMDDPRIIDGVGITVRKNCGMIPIGHGELDVGNYNQPKEIFGASAGASLYKSEMLIQVGLFEEECFAYHEDVDLALRARIAGWKCLYVPQAVVYHKHSGTLGKYSPIKKYYLIRNRYYYVIKNLPAPMVFKFFIIKTKNIIDLIVMIPIRLVLFDMKRFHTDIIKLKAHCHAIKNIPKMFRKRNEIRSKRMISDRELVRWFVA